MSTVSFGKRERIKFKAEGSLGRWQPASGPAIYAITYKQEPMARPKAHTVLFFGEAENLAEEVESINRTFEELRNPYAGDAELFVFSCSMPESSRGERNQIAKTLVFEYDPKANN